MLKYKKYLFSIIFLKLGLGKTISMFVDGIF